MSHFHDSWIKLISYFKNITLLDVFDNPLSLEVVVKAVDPECCLLKNLTMIRLPKRLSDYLIDKHVLQEEWEKEQPLHYRRKKTSTPVSKMIAYLKHVRGKGFIGTNFHDKEQLRRLLHARFCEERLYDLMFL
jgi:hypothetical protein